MEMYILNNFSDNSVNNFPELFLRYNLNFTTNR